MHGSIRAVLALSLILMILIGSSGMAAARLLTDADKDVADKVEVNRLGIFGGSYF